MFSVSLITEHDNENNSIPLNVDGITIFGRGEYFKISDKRISRKFGEITTSSASKSVTIRPLSAIPSFIIRENKKIKLEKDSLLELQNNDIISILGKYKFRLHIEFSSEEGIIYENLSEDATQLDFEYIDEIEKKNNIKRKEFQNSKDDIEIYKEINFNKKIKIYSDFIKPLSRSDSNTIILKEELTFIRLIGSGTCGEVYEANWKKTRVAAKKIYRSILHDNNIKEFQTETDILKRLRHPNIVYFLGTCNLGDHMCIVTEYIERGNLSHVLKDSTIPLNFSLKIKMALDAAKGMNYLHTYKPPIIHRDLKSYNLLVNNDFTLKVSDFGLAKFQKEEKSDTCCGTIPWSAPEILCNQGYTTSADVYSFGIVLWELITREEPYAGLNNPQIILKVINNERLPIPKECPISYSTLIEYCWSHDPSKRPTFNKILEHLESINSTISNENYKIEIGKTTSFSLTQQFQNFQIQSIKKKNELEIIPNELKFEKELIEDYFSHIYLGKYQQKDVIIKIFKENENFTKELEYFKLLKNNNYVVLFLGFCIIPQHSSIITEYLPNLLDLMNMKDFLFHENIIINIIINSVKAINSLHNWNPKIIHKYLKPQNFLVNQYNWFIKLTDFKFAEIINNNNNNNNNNLFSLDNIDYYSSPEIDRGEPLTIKTDIFSFGIIMWELIMCYLTGYYQKAFSEYNFSNEIQLKIQILKGIRPSFPNEFPIFLSDLIKKCWNDKVNERPTTEEILFYLENKI